MKLLFHRQHVKFTIIALIITAVVLLCPAIPAPASAATACEPASIFTHGHLDKNITGGSCSKTHVEMGSHAANLTATINYSAVLAAAMGALFILLFQNHEPSAAAYASKLKYYRHRHRIRIKPKLNKSFLRWLNMLGDSIALSF